MGLYHEMQPLTPEQAQRLLQVAHDHRLHASLTVTIATGMRKGELFGLHWQDIDFDAGCLYVRRSVKKRLQANLAGPIQALPISH